VLRCRRRRRRRRRQVSWESYRNREAAFLVLDFTFFQVFRSPMELGAGWDMCGTGGAGGPELVNRNDFSGDRLEIIELK
jgi:hypothetical protein